jgi:hypothetical protein
VQTLAIHDRGVYAVALSTNSSHSSDTPVLSSGSRVVWSTHHALRAERIRVQDAVGLSAANKLLLQQHDDRGKSAVDSVYIRVRELSEGSGAALVRRSPKSYAL